MGIRKITSFDGTKIAYEFRQGKGPCLVFIHGSGGNHSVWNRYLKHLDGHKLIGVDLRGHGHSERGEISLTAAAQDILEILKKEKITNAILIGKCLGAAIALQAYRLNPKPIKGFVFTSLLHKRYIRYPVLTDAVTVIYYYSTFLFRVRRSHRFIDYSKYFRKKFLYPILDLINAHHSVHFGMTYQLFEYQSDLTQIQIPTLIFQGRHDLLSKNRRIIKDALRNRNITFHEVLPLLKAFIKKWSA